MSERFLARPIMSPSVAAAVALLGVWIVLMFAVTAVAGEDQLRATSWFEDGEDRSGPRD
ncbi:hypothetical protein Natoc_2044 [Natronococcus occultus SP4]|uniref:Uncharacterized protein n=1 Tax=Natronococcus occultus SP4 TaxID=694430 RepID=L0JZW9_9EURY|nr:hypothetical protein Natoc_2044 [Natronococcus occultus SP4]